MLKLNAPPGVIHNDSQVNDNSVVRDAGSTIINFAAVAAAG